jgi:hypothetical protein
MEVPQLTEFFLAINDDHRISRSHISLYMALFEYWNLNHFNNHVSFTRKSIVSVARINGISTYHRIIKELHDFGYIRYVPSFHPANGSQVYFLSL